MKILFICKHNRFRSKVSDSIFKKLNKGENEARSAGVVLDLLHPYIENIVKKIMKEKEYEIKGTPRQINNFDLKWADKIIIMADDVSLDLLKNFIRKIKASKSQDFDGAQKSKQTEKISDIWKIEDCDASDEENIWKIIKKIEKRVKKLINSLK